MKELFELAEQEGKVVIASEDGKIKGVLLSLECYQVLSGTAPKSALTPTPEPEVPAGPDAETINRAITEAQLEIAMPQVSPAPAPVPLNSVLARRVNELRQRQQQGQNDLRAEVMDPNFDYSPPTLSVDDEVIRPGFDDI